MGVTYDMLSNYEINNIITQEATRSYEKRTPLQEQTPQQASSQQSSPERAPVTTTYVMGDSKFKNPQLEAAT